MSVSSSLCRVDFGADDSECRLFLFLGKLWLWLKLSEDVRISFDSCLSSSSEIGDDDLEMLPSCILFFGENIRLCLSCGLCDHLKE